MVHFSWLESGITNPIQVGTSLSKASKIFNVCDRDGPFFLLVEVECLGDKVRDDTKEFGGITDSAQDRSWNIDGFGAELERVNEQSKRETLSGQNSVNG